MNEFITLPSEPEHAVLPRLVAAETCEPTHEEISVCAYYIWLSEGRPENKDSAHWFEAETQLRECCHVDRRLSAAHVSPIPAQPVEIPHISS